MRRWLLALCVLATAAAPAVAWFVGDDDPAELRAQADAELAKKNFQTALDLYDRIPAPTPGSPDDRHIGLRRLRCLAALEQDDRLLTDADAFVVRAGDAVETLEARLLAGRCALDRRHDGTLWRGTFYRGEWKRGGTWTSREREDLTVALTHLEAARTLGGRLLAAADDPDTRALAITAQVELARAVVATEDARTVPDGLAPPDPAAPFDPAAPAVARVAWLLRDIDRLDTAQPKEHAARALYTLATHLRPIEQAPAGWRIEPLLREVSERYPGTRAAAEARYALGVWLEETEQYVDAVGVWDALIAADPAGPFAVHAQRRADAVRRPQLGLQTPPPVMPGATVELTIASRSCATVQLAAWRIDLAAWVRRGLSDLGPVLVGVPAEDGTLPELGAPVATWAIATGDRGDYQPRETKAAAPLTARGAYAVVARSEGLTVAGLCLVTDLTAVVSTDRTRALVFAADAAGGEPVPEVSVLVRERWHTNGQWHVVHAAGVTGVDGCSVTDRGAAPGRGTNLEVVATAGDRVAATPSVWSWSSRERGTEFVAYCETDRPVYRPGHTVHCKTTLRQRTGGALAVPGTDRVWVDVRDPKGAKVLADWFQPDAHGMVQFDVALDGRAVLGQYRVAVRSAESRGRTFGSSAFRVEEYRRPEIEVRVEPGAAVSRIGRPVTARIVATYYFGGPVAGADVTWRVSRRYVRPRRVVSGHWDWLYGRGYGLRPMGGPREGRNEVVAKGTGTTAPDGSLAVTIPTAHGEGEWAELDQELTVWAEVTDASRRTIEGMGQVRASRRAVHLFVDATRGYARVGETLEATVSAVTADGTDTDATGEVILERLTLAPGADPTTPPTATRIESRPFTTAVGAPEAPVVRFVVDAPGVYRLRAVAPDAWDGTTEGWTRLTVTGDTFAGDDYRYAELDCTLDRPVYRVGESAGVLLESPFQGGAVLLTEVVDQRILSWRIVRLHGRVGEAAIALTPTHQPNAWLVARLVHGGEVRYTRRQLLVPPHDRMLQVQVTPDHSDYRPGQTATVTVRTLGPDGTPAAGVPVSLGVVDRSLFYIQPEIAPDLRQFFYGRRNGDDVRRTHSGGWRTGGWHADHSGRPRLRGGAWPTGWWGFDWGRQPRASGGLSLGVPGDEEPSESANAEGAEEEEKLDKDGGSGGAFGGRMGGRRELRARGGGGKAGAPAAAPPAPEQAQKNEEPHGADDGPAAGGDAPIRRNFAETAFWNPVLVTGADGTARATFTMPDSVTGWRLLARAIGDDSRVGSDEGTVVTRKPLVVRLAAPRFLIDRDEVVFSVTAVSGLATDVDVALSLELQGEALAPLAGPAQTLHCPAGGEVRADFRTRAVRAGHVRLIARASSGGESDALARTLPIRTHGAHQESTVAGLHRGPGTATHTVSIPALRDPAATVLEVTVQPTLGGVLLEGIPYLLQYPYGCVEQTMSRFLPAVQVARTLQDLGIDLAATAQARGALDPRLLPDGGDAGPVFDPTELQSIVRAGLARLQDFQHGDGGWGWWKDGDSDPYMTAYVTHGLLVARDADVAVPDRMLARALEFLAGSIVALEDRPEHWAFAAYVCVRGTQVEAARLEALYPRRAELSLQGKALLALALQGAGMADRAHIAWENLAERVTVNTQSGTAALPDAPHGWWWWWNDQVESTAWALRAFLAVAPEDPRTPGLARWLVNNRTGGRWKSTKDTALAIGALSAYMRHENELDCDCTVTVSIDGTPLAPMHFTRANAIGGAGRVMLLGSAVDAGDHAVVVTSTGRGNCYYTVNARYFTMEEDIPASSYEIHVDRRYFKLTPREEQRDGRTVLAWDRTPLASGAGVVSGDRVEVLLTITADNDYDYVAVEDRKLAGLEPIAIRSGGGHGAESHREFRDEQVVCFFTRLPKGVTEVAYQLRAEAPGAFHGLPARAYAMYAPRATGTSTEHRAEVTDK